MKNSIFLILILFLISSCKKEEIPPAQPGERMMWFEQLEANFMDPPAEYRTAPFWVWNTKVTKADIDRTLAEYKNKGYGGVFLHPRYGLITEYLSDEWFDLVKYSLEKAEELDLKLWLYDENSFPSGFAGGHVPAEMPEANSEGVALKPYFMNVLKIPADAERVLHVFQKEGELWKDISNNYKNIIGQKGEFCVLDLNDYEKSKWFGGYSYIDLLKPGVTEKFIEITMPGYEKAIGHEFGKRVPGIFTDEPNINTRSAGPIRYTPDLYEQFEKQWGYRLEPHLMELITETGDWQKTRHDYQATLLHLFIERWSKPWHKYTEEKNLNWTGHYWEHGWPNPKEGPDNMAMYAWHQTPAIDMLFNAEELRPDQFGNIRNVKELSSVANQFDRHRALSETYGAAGWELTFDDMKRLGDWEFVLGVNLMNQHLSYMSLAGDRKHDFPQGFGPYSPYWGVMRYHTDYFARLSLALSSGLQKNKILVIEPTTTAWMYYNPTTRVNTKMNEVKKQFEGFLTQLEKYQVEYDLGCEDIIRNHGKIENGQFVVNKRAYETILLPPGIENLEKATFELLKQFAEAGGEIIQADEPIYVDAKNVSFTELQNKENWKVETKIDNSFFKALAKNNFIEFANIDSVQGNIFHQRREFENGQLLFITNFDKNKIGNLKINMAGKSVLLLNAADGKISPYIYKKKGSRVEFNVELYPSGSCLLFVSDKKGDRKKEEVQTRTVFETGKLEIARLTPNVINLDYVELTMGKFKNEPMYFYKAANEIWKKHGFADNPWVSSSQFKTEILDKNNFGKGSGFIADYPFVVDAGFKTDSLKLVVERPWLYTIWVNGNQLEQKDNKPWMDPEFLQFEIAHFIVPGQNKIRIKAAPFSVFCELEPVYLLGNFSVEPAEKGWVIQAEKELGLGSWKKQGLPFYNKTASYKKNINVKVGGDYIIHLPNWKGTVAEVKIDGKHSGVIQSPPYELKLPFKYGIHEIEVIVTGSNKNLFGPFHNFKTPGLVTPWSFKTAPETQPAGIDYDLLDYGLMEDFEVIRIKK